MKAAPPAKRKICTPMNTQNDSHSRGISGWISDQIAKSRVARLGQQILGAPADQRESAVDYLTTHQGLAPADAAEMVLNAELSELAVTNPEIADRLTSVTAAGAGAEPDTFRQQLGRLTHPSNGMPSTNADWFKALEQVSEYVRTHGRVPELQLNR